MNENEQRAIALTAGNGGTYDHTQFDGWVGPGANTTNPYYYTQTINILSEQEIKLRQLAVEYAVRAIPFESNVDVDQIDTLINYFYNFLKTGSTVQKAEPATIDNF